MTDAEADFATIAEIVFRAGGRYGIEARPWKRPELFGAGWNGLDLFSIEAGIEAWWSVVNDALRRRAERRRSLRRTLAEPPGNA